MYNIEKCPNCKSDAIERIYELHHAFCKHCHHGWKIEASPPSNAPLSNSLDPQIKQFCKNLAESNDWVEKVSNEWPAPIAHEYYRLKEILAQEQQILTAIWQFTDVADLLIKFPAVVMAQWVFTHQADSELANEVKQNLLAKPLTMGGWQHLARDTLAQALSQDLPQIAKLFRSTDTKNPTEFSKVLDEIIKWRNDVFAHGALALDVNDFKEDFSNLIKKLNIQLSKYQDIWDATQLLDNKDQQLHGWQKIRHRHQSQQGKHIEEDLPLQFSFGNQEILSLSPLLTLKHCTICNKQDVFIFDSRKNQNQIYFLDYLGGHKIQRAGHLEPELAITLTKTVEELPKDADLDAAYGSKQLDELLQSKSLEAEYFSPEYLRTDLKSFLQNHQQGVYWLRAPAHIGKSLFVHGLRIKEALLSNLKVVNFHIRREYRYHKAHFKDYITDQLKNTLNLRANTKELPELDLKHPKPAEALSSWLGEMLDIYRDTSQCLEDKLLLSIDGLDELNTTESRTLLDFIPKPEQLSPGCYVLLTSRLQEGCPESIWQKLESQVEAVIKDIDLDTKDYQQLLRQFFNKRLQARITDRSIQEQLFKQVLEHSEGRFLYLSFLCNLLQQDYHLDLSTLENFPKGSDLYGHYLNQLEQVLSGKQWEYIKRLLLILTAAEQAELKDFELRTGELKNSLEWSGINLQVLATWLGEAAVNSVQLVFALYSLKELLRAEKDRCYKLGLKGLSSVLQERWSDELKQEHRQLAAQFHKDWHKRYEKLQLSEADINYSFRHLLAHTELSQDEDLKKSVWNDNKLAEAYLEQGTKAYERSEYAAAVEWHTCAMLLYQYLFEHTKTISYQNKLSATYINRGIASRSLGELENAMLDYKAALQLKQQLRQRINQNYWPPQWLNGLAAIYMNRGVALIGKGELAGAVRNYRLAIQLLKKLREQMKENWPPEWQNDLATIYLNRGVALDSLGKHAAAVDDYKIALKLREQLHQWTREKNWPPQWRKYADANYCLTNGLMLMRQNEITEAIRNYGLAINYLERLRQHMKDDWPPKWQNYLLAAAYMNRGIARKNQGEMAAAMRDYDKAIQLREQLRQRMEKNDWPSQWQNDLAMVYMNRGNALKSKKHLAKAVHDYGIAIELREQLHQRIEKNDWPPQWQNELAETYINRGIALENQGKLTEAVQDYGIAIEFINQLYQRIGEKDWPLQWQNDLAKVYWRRAIVFEKQQKLTESITDYKLLIKLKHELLFDKKIISVIPDLAKVFYHLLYLSAEFEPQQWHNQATSFLQRLEDMLEIEQLSEHWQRKLECLQELLNNF